ncbi:MAG: FKBP-type peptidyl-prolyl cis-trans isomerase [Dysgonomonas sp.]
MKKIQILALGTFVAVGAFFTSCNKGASVGGASLKSDMDTLSYVLGAQMADGLTNELQQMGIYTDTAALNQSYKARILAEKDATKKTELEKEFKNKLDSVNSANKKNLAEFLKGLSQVMNMGDDKKAFAGGLMVGSQLKMQIDGFEKQAFAEGSGKKISKKVFLSAFESIVNGGTSAIPNTQEVLRSKMDQIQKEAQDRQAKENEAKYAENKAAGEKFLENFRKEAGVVSLPSGIAYQVITEGSGAKPTATDQVKVRYCGTLIDGTVFDGGMDKEPTVLPVSPMIQGWTEVLQLMPVGSKWKVAIPYSLAYNEREVSLIKPYSTIVFEIELISIEKAQANSAQPQANPAQRR